MKMRKMMSLLLLVLLVFSNAAFASESDITSPYIVHKQAIEKAKMDKNNVKNEYEILQELKNLDEEELIKKDLSIEKINKIEKEMSKELKRRSKLESKELKEMGYSDEKIETLRNLSDDATLEQAATKGLLASCYVYNTCLSHVYTGSRTNFTVQFGWHWDMSPMIAFKDTIGIGWSPDFSFDTTKTNKLDILYNDGSGHSHTSTNYLIENDINTSTVTFELCDRTAPCGTIYQYARDGVGTANLTILGKESTAKFSFKYAHNTLGMTITLSGTGINFNLINATEIYQPQIINSQRNF